MNQSRLWFAGVFVALGALFALDAADALDSSGPLLFSIGFFVVAGALIAQAVRPQPNPALTSDRVNTVVAFGEAEVTSRSRTPPRMIAILKVTPGSVGGCHSALREGRGQTLKPCMKRSTFDTHVV
jgi:hypothetical protein